MALISLGKNFPGYSKNFWMVSLSVIKVNLKLRERSSPVSTWQIDHRRGFIEHRLFWRGRLRLADLVEAFGISRTQASLDINAYIAEFPGHLDYDKSDKHYVPGPGFTPHYTSLDPAEHLDRLLAISRGADVPKGNWDTPPPAIHAPPIPARGMQNTILRDVLRAIEETRELTILYQSMSAPEPAMRRIAPHALCHDGFRWHARALCLRDAIFKDFLISRMIETTLGPMITLDPAMDQDWNTEVTLTIAPHPDLSPTLAKAIALDYAMENGTATLRVRKSMLYYTLRRLGLDTDPGTKRAQDQQIVLIGRSDNPTLDNRPTTGMNIL